MLPYIEQLEEYTQNLLSVSGAVKNRPAILKLAVSEEIFSTANKSELCSSLYLRNPDIQLELSEIPFHEIREQILGKQMDTALVYLPFRQGEEERQLKFGAYLDTIELSRQPLCFCMSLTHPLAQKQEICFSEIAGETFIFHTDIGKIFRAGGTTVHSMFLEECERNHFSPRILTVDRNLADNKHALAKCGRGIYPTFVPGFLHSDSELIYMPVKDAHYYVKYYLVSAKDSTKKKNIRYLGEFLKEQFRKIQNF